MLSIVSPSRRGFITGLIAFAAAPAIVRASSLMPVKAMVPDLEWFDAVNRFETYTSYYRWDVPDGVVYGRSPGMLSDDWHYVASVVNVDTSLPGNPNLIGMLTTELRRAPPIVEFDKIDTSDPLWAMPKPSAI